MRWPEAIRRAGWWRGVGVRACTTKKNMNVSAPHLQQYSAAEMGPLRIQKYFEAIKTLAARFSDSLGLFFFFSVPDEHVG